VFLYFRKSPLECEKAHWFWGLDDACRADGTPSPFLSRVWSGEVVVRLLLAAWWMMGSWWICGMSWTSRLSSVHTATQPLGADASPSRIP
jgi:hypothetical protein